jgi:hypothetical protein
MPDSKADMAYAVPCALLFADVDLSFVPLRALVTANKRLGTSEWYTDEHTLEREP